MKYNYDKDVDYSILMQEAASKGDFEAAARYEQQRNAKIQGEGMHYATTNRYSQYLQPEGSGSGLAGIAKQTGVYPVKPTFRQDSYGSKPSYENQYADRIDALLNEILSRDAFSYDVESDPMYRQLQVQYNREGNRAMNDTLAAAAVNAGGMNSYAMTAAQQANDYYAAQLADRIPELYQLAYSMYMDDLSGKRTDLSMLQNAEQLDYGKYLDDLGQWNTDRNFAYGQYRDDMGDYQWGTEFNYNAQRDQIADERYEREWSYQTQQDTQGAPGPDDSAAAERQRKQQTAEEAAAGLPASEYDVNALVVDAMASEDPAAFIRDYAGFYRYGRNSGTDNASGDGDGYNATYDYAAMAADALGNGGDLQAWLDQNRDYYRYSRNGGQADLGMTDADRAAVQALGAGAIPAETLLRLVECRAVETDAKTGRLRWANGWSASNYEQKLKKIKP